MFWFFLVLLLAYLSGLLLILRAWRGLKSHRVGSATRMVSVLVPFRNEEQHLERLVEALGRQTHRNFEVIFINDHSTDASLGVLNELLSSASLNSQVLSLTVTSGKKAAIGMGVSLAKGEVILTTDADCVFEKHWITRMTSPFISDSVLMISGPVKLIGESLFQRWQQMEFSVLIATGAAGIAWQQPSMANGANLAYRKSVFESVDGFDGVDVIASGDDELLMMKVQEKYPGSIGFVKEIGAMVSTEALVSWKDFRNQRLRWAGKWRFGKRRGTIMGALAVFVFNLSVLLLPVLAFTGSLAWWQVLAFVLIRLLAELGLILFLNLFFGNRMSVISFLLHQILYPFYAVYFGVAANFGNFQWKGRTYKAPVQ